MFAILAGYVYVTGRIKEILITRGGENVAPIPIENCLLEHCKVLSACMVVGDNQKYLTMLVTLRCKVRLCLRAVANGGSAATSGSCTILPRCNLIASWAFNYKLIS